ncbi:MAG: hypothetical protein JSW73_05030 [Candidatus Woesearchaeota archaeon]|nr:MAG: hypothetical protein JSW73_05030 [Candidatus Woesearchaeota archaeon]
MKTVNIKLIEIVNRDKEDITNKDLVERLKDKKTGLKKNDLILIYSKTSNIVKARFYHNCDSAHINSYDVLIKSASVSYTEDTHKPLSDVKKIYKIELPSFIKE